MDTQTVIHLLEQKEVKPTVNRILVYQTLVQLGRPVSLRDMENEMLTLDKSSIFLFEILLLEIFLLEIYNPNLVTGVIDDGALLLESLREGFYPLTQIGIVGIDYYSHRACCIRLTISAGAMSRQR